MARSKRKYSKIYKKQNKTKQYKTLHRQKCKKFKILELLRRKKLTKQNKTKQKTKKTLHEECCKCELKILHLKNVRKLVTCEILT